MEKLKNLIITHKYISILILLCIIMISILITLFFKYTHTESYSDIINKVTSAKITDMYENKYEEELSIDIKEKDLKQLKKLLINNKPTIKSNISSNICKIVLYDKDNDIIETLIINYNKDIISSRGTFENSALDDYCTKLEKKYKLDYDKILSRKPGKNYFKDLSKCTSGSIINNKNNKSKDLSAEHIISLREISNIKILKRKDFDIKYRITLYNDTENISYIFDVSSDNKIYCNKWELDGNIVSIINDLIKKLKI